MIMIVRMNNGSVYKGWHSIEVVMAMASAAGFDKASDYMYATSKALASARGVQVRNGTTSWFITDLVEAGLATVEGESD
jgi:hypothetical protein